MDSTIINKRNEPRTAGIQPLRRLSRRQFLRHAVGGVALLAAGGLTSTLAGCVRSDHYTPAPTSEALAANTPHPDLEIAMRAAPDELQILPGAPTRVWRYQAEVIRGRPDAVQPLPNSYLGPLLRFQEGERVRIHFTNDLSEPSIVHWHGLHVPEEADGHPRLAIESGETYTYDYPVISRPGTYWYHPHPHGRTGPQVYNGLAGLLIVDGAEDATAGLPGGDQDIPLVIQDRTFDDNNQFIYLGEHMGARILGFAGDQILVNGKRDFVQPVATQPYRLRLLNGSNARIYKLGYEDNRPLTVIGTDGGLLERPVTRPYVTLAPGERVELWADFGADEVGSEIVLEDKEFSGRQPFPVARFQVAREAVATHTLPATLSRPVWHRVEDAVNRNHPRTFEMEMARMTWHLNGRTFEMDKVARNEIVKLGDLEVWEFVNESAHMAMPHPMHIHNVQFQVIERRVLPDHAAESQRVAAGYVDEGWKDTVLVMPGERVKVLLKFERYTGLYLYHCHNLEHEDMGMMRNYRIKA